MADVDDQAEKTASSQPPEIVDDLLLKIFRLTPSENDRNKPQFLLASEHLNSLASDFYPYIPLSLVSKHWNSLIFNNFRPSPKPVPAAGLIFECPTSIRTAHSCHSYILFLDQSISTSPFMKINSVDHPWHYRSKVVHSCNGLLLCASKRTRHHVYSVCNPTTGKYSALPQVPPADIDSKIIRGAYLAFDPCKSSHYKVVCVLGLEDDSRYFQSVVYSSKTGSWGKCGKLFKIKTDIVPSFGNGVYWNGAIHWVGGSSKLIRFNLEDDDRLAPRPLKVMPMPIARNHERYYFGESYGHLHYIGLNDGVREIVVHELSSDYSGWAVKYKVDVTKCVRRTFFDHAYFDNIDLTDVVRLASYYRFLCDNFNVYAVVRGKRSEDMFLVLGTTSRGRGRRQIIQFNHRDNTFETIYDFNVYKNALEVPEEQIRPFHYIESLASV